MIVRGRRELDQNLADNADTRLLLIRDRQVVEVMDDALADLLVFPVADRLAIDETAAVPVPFLIHLVRGALHLLIWAHAVQALHQDVAEYNRVDELHEKLRCDLEARLRLKAVEIERKDRHLLVARLLQRAPDERDVVGRTAAAACLRDDERRAVKIILARLQRGHELSDDKQRRIARVVVDVLEPHVDGLTVVIFKDL